MKGKGMIRTVERLFALVFCFWALVSLAGCSDDTPTLSEEEQNQFLGMETK